MGCGTSCAKYLFFAFNLVFWILGIVVFAIGIYSRVENDSWKDLVIDSTTFSEAANLLIAAGVIVALIGFFGCCGAIKKQKWMLVVYSILVVLIFILQLAAGVYAYAKKDTIENTLAKKIKVVVKKSYGKTDTTANKGLTKAVDWLQQNAQCCGAEGASDWKTSSWMTGKSSNTRVPDSCCQTPEDGCGVSNKTLPTMISEKIIYKNGCMTAGKMLVKDNLYLVGGVGVAVAIIELFGVIFALCLCKAFRAEDKAVSA